MKEGWICPKCGAGVNPDRDSCPCVVAQPVYIPAPPTYVPVPYPSPTTPEHPNPWYGPWQWQTTCTSDSTHPVVVVNG